MYLIQDEKITGQQLFDDQFISELKRFFSYGNRRTRRSTILARVLLETAIESGNEIKLIDHHLCLNSDAAIRYMEDYIKNIYQWYRDQGVIFKNIMIRNGKIYAELYPDTENLILYSKLRIKEIEYKPIQKEREFSKLLLII